MEINKQKEIYEFLKNYTENKGYPPSVSRRDFSYYDVTAKGWVVDSGVFQILIGKSSRNICLTEKIYVKS